MTEPVEKIELSKSQTKRLSAKAWREVSAITMADYAVALGEAPRRIGRFLSARSVRTASAPKKDQ